MVTLGDSNTYGLFVEHSAAWPAVLERSLLAPDGERAIEVINLGYPGMNSSRMRNLLPDVLESLHPDLATVMIGVNDF